MILHRRDIRQASFFGAGACAGFTYNGQPFTGAGYSPRHALAHWCGHVSLTEDLAVAVAATNYAVEGATGEFSCFVCSEETYALTFPEPLRKSAMRWLHVHAHYDDDHPWMALDIVATLLGNNPSPASIVKIRNSIAKSYDYLRMTLDYAYGQSTTGYTLKTAPSTTQHSIQDAAFA